MSNTTIAMHLIKKIYSLDTKGYSKVKISERLQLSRNTVKKYIRFLRQTGVSNEDLQQMSDEELSDWFKGSVARKSPVLQALEKYFPSFEKRLSKSNASRYLLWEEYKSKHPEGLMYSRFCHYYRLWKKTSNPSMRFDHKAGDKMFVDFAGQKLYVHNKSTGERRAVEVFVSVLGASQLTYVEACESQKKEDFIGACEHALHHCGGVPACIVTDNLKAAVKKSNKYEPSLNETFADFASHYDTTIIPCRAYKPQDKALVERMVGVIYTRVYYEIEKQTFYSIEALNHAIWELLEKHNDKRLQRRPYSRRQFFEEVEKQCLQPLPSQTYELKRYSYATVYKNCYVYLQKDKHYYSVPYQYIGQKIKIVYSNSSVEVYKNYQRIAFHKRDRSPYQYTYDEKHLPANHKYVKNWSREFFMDQAAEVGVHCEQFVAKVIEEKRHPEAGFKACMGILDFRKKVSDERLENACNRAIEYEAFSYKAIKNILENNLDLIQEEQAEEVKIIPLHGNIRGKEYYK